MNEIYPCINRNVRPNNNQLITHYECVSYLLRIDTILLSSSNRYTGLHFTRFVYDMKWFAKWWFNTTWKVPPPRVEPWTFHSKSKRHNPYASRPCFWYPLYLTLPPLPLLLFLFLIPRWIMLYDVSLSCRVY